jgi:metalloendopeptidase OMA1, mitochondrial
LLCAFRKKPSDVSQFVPGILLFLAVFCSSCAPSRASLAPGHIPPPRQVSLEDEKVGHQLLRQLSQKYPLDFDHPRRAEVDEIVHKLTDSIGASSQPWHVNVFTAPDVKNAAATRGNHIFIWTGMIDATRNKDELAAILGHEVGHILARHTDPSQDEVWRRVLVEGISVAAAIGVLATTRGAQGSNAAADLAASLTRAAGQGIFVNPYSQNKELEADQIGLYLMARAGYRPEAAIEFWERALHDPSFSASVPFLSTHPPASRRLDHLKGLILMMNNGSMSHTPVSASATQGTTPQHSPQHPPQTPHQSVQPSPLPPAFQAVSLEDPIPEAPPALAQTPATPVILKEGDSFDIRERP